MTENNPHDLANSLRKWLEAGNLNDMRSVPQTIDIAQMKRKAAQRIMAAQRAQSDFDGESEETIQFLEKIIQRNQWLSTNRLDFYCNKINYLATSHRVNIRITAGGLV